MTSLANPVKTTASVQIFYFFGMLIRGLSSTDSPCQICRTVYVA